MFKKIEKLLLQRFVLNQKKYVLIRKLGSCTFSSISSVGRIGFIIEKEISVNKKVCKALRRLSPKYSEVVEPVYSNLHEINKALVEEKKVLFKINYMAWLYSHLNSSFLKNRVRNLKRSYEHEIALNKFFLEGSLVRFLPKAYRLDKDKLKKSFNLLLKLQEEVHKLASSVGDSRLVKLHGKHVLKLSDLVKKTELYGFVKQDVSFIKRKSFEMIKHPKENKLAYALGTFYIVSPGTFELTGVVLFFKYLGQYSVSKVKKLKKS